MITLGGVRCSILSPFRWEISQGLTPNESVMMLPREDAESMFASLGGSPLDLAIGADVYRNVYITAMMGGVSRHERGLLISDARYLLDYPGESVDYNLRERIGETRLVGPGTFQNLQVVPAVRYRMHSLNGQNPWTLEEALADQILRTSIDLPVFFRPVPTLSRTLPLEDFSSTGSRRVVLEELLARAPGYAWTFTRDGFIAITDAISDTEGSPEIAKQQITFMDQGWVETIDRTFLKPSKLRIHFVAEQELRFDYDEDAEELSRGLTSEDAFRPPRNLECVFVNPIRVLQIGGQPIGEGAIVRLVDLIRELPTQPDPTLSLNPLTAGIGPLTYKVLRYGLLKKGYVFQRYHVQSTGNRENWHRLIREVAASFRRNFRIIPAWREKIRSFKTTRVMLADPITTTFVKSRPYTDVTFIPSQSELSIRSGIFFNRRNQEGWVVRGYADDLANATLTDGEFSIRDQAAGFVRMRLEKGPYDEEESVIPGVLKFLPTVTDRKSLAGSITISRDGELLSGWKMASVFTCVQTSPQGRGRFHEVTRTPGDVRNVLGRSVGLAQGPPMDVFVAETPTTTARFGWLDSEASAIEDSFSNGTPRPVSLLTNSQLVNAIADGVAASVYSGLLNRLDGSARGPTGQGSEAFGQVSSVSSFEAPGGVSVGEIRVNGRISPVDFASYLPDAIKRQVLGQVQP